MNQSQMETLLAIVDEGSFEVAAAVLGVSPSAVSQRIKSLESSTGRVLLRRSTPVTPTEAGEILVQTARHVALVQAEAKAQLSQHMRNVPLSVAVNADSLNTWFKDVIADTAAHGDVSLKIRVEDENATLGMLRRGDVVGAVTSEPNPVAGCESTPVGTMRYFAMASPSMELRAWDKMPAVLYNQQDPLFKRWLRGKDLTLRDLSRRVSYIPSVDAYNDAVRVGLGWGMIPEIQASELLARGELVIIDDTPLELDLYWQRWRLESAMLERLTASVFLAAAGALPPGN
ncbi:LysR family transcriptional regulator [Corynebacterium phocae]|uniref:LysR family transcriptional regulator n=1 Tax=Corynebacterium phocae TaxID=161895 RepID=A0A1L7D3K0_9CORY|nr:LysR family transcriptional regulator ArgP [Corynebacterium phocae]APT92729.1 LysR family transcriptional regulator [Corynebacterium phocae]KAA8723037.1 LysR family transcriptional regulator ArgP [Corynebacterium phocae]